MTRTKVFVALSVTVALCIATARTGYSVEICEVVSPRRFDKLHSFPVSVVVQFSRGARPDTFRASLNGIDITSKFQENRKDELRALIGPEDGLRMEVKTNPQGKINALRTVVKGLKPEQDLDFETFFFAEVDKLTTVGTEGGAIKSLDGDVLIEIPNRALSFSTAIALTRVDDSAQTAPVYHLAPEGIKFSKPVTVTIKYHPAKLPPGVTDDDLFLIFGHEFPRKPENLLVDKTTHTVRGTIMFFSTVSMSCYMKIGKRLTDIPLATDFRLPIGDNAATYAACGRDDPLPSKSDLGEALTLLHRSSYADFDYPRIILNENGTDNTWYVTRAYNRNRYVNAAAGPTTDSRSLYRQDEGMFSNGEDWSFRGRRNVHQGFPVHAIADGLVIYNGRGNGNAVALAHRIAGGAILSVYSYMREKSPCAVGTLVRKGNVIGEIGRFGTGDAYLHYGIGKQSLVRLDSKTGEIKVPAAWFWESKQDSVSDNYYDPTNFLFQYHGEAYVEFQCKRERRGLDCRKCQKI